MKNRALIVFLTVLVAASILFAACAQPAPTPTATATPTPTATATPTPTAVTATKLTFAVMMAPPNFYALTMQDWANELKEKTGGRYDVTFGWGGSMGPGDRMIDFTRTGTVDMCFTNTAYALGTLPLSSVFLLPIKATPELARSADAYEELIKTGLLDKELSDFKVVAAHNSFGQRVTLRKGPLTSLADIQGKKIRFSGQNVGNSLKALGAVPVALALPEIYEALQKGTVDGTMTEWDMMVDWKLNEQVKAAIEPGFFRVAQFIFMNKSVYNKLPKDVQSIIDGMYDKYSKLMGEKLYARSKQGTELFLNTGGTLSKWSDADLAKMDEAFAPLWKNWITDTEGKGLPAKDLLAKLYKTFEDLGVKKPFIGYTP